MSSESSEDKEVTESRQNDPDNVFESPPEKQKVEVKIYEKVLLSTLDRTGTSDRNATLIIITTLQSVGIDVDYMIFSKSSVHRFRQKNRSVLENVKILSNFSVFSVVHWNRKLSKGLNTKQEVDKLTVHITGMGEATSLGTTPLDTSSEKMQACAALELLEERQLTNDI